MKELKNIPGNIIYPVNLDVRLIFDYNTLWTNTEGMAFLFNAEEISVQNTLDMVFYHTGLSPESVMAQGPFYNLDVIRAVGNKLNPAKTQSFVIWAVKVIKDHYSQPAGSTSR